MAIASITLLFCLRSWQTIAATPQITGVSAANGKVMMTWTGDSYAYEVQSSASLKTPNWNSVLATARTNAAIPLGGSAAFFRILTPETNTSSLVVTTTNLATGDVFTFTREPQTNADLVFDNFADTNAAAPVMETLAAADTQQFDFWFDGTGGFLIVSSNGAPSGFGGVMFISPGPGSTQTSFQGLLTNDVAAVSFFAIADSAPGRTALKDGGDGTGGAALGVGDAALSGFWCASAWAVQNLGCQSGCLAKGVACVGFYPPPPKPGGLLLHLEPNRSQLERQFHGDSWKLRFALRLLLSGQEHPRALGLHALAKGEKRRADRGPWGSCRHGSLRSLRRGGWLRLPLGFLSWRWYIP